MTGTDTIHGTVVAVGGKGVLLTGPSGSGKSDLALRLIDRGASLVADDRVVLAVRDGQLSAAAPKRLAGLLEVRGLGIIPVGHMAEAPLALVVELVPWTEVPRLPEKDTVIFHEHEIPLLHLNAFEMSTVIKIEFALRHPSWIASEGNIDEGG